MSRTYEEIDTIMSAKGMPWEVKTMVIKGRTVDTYVAIPDSIRDFFEATKVHGDKVFIVYQDERITYNQAHARVTELASLLHSMKVVKGDRVALAMRNLPDYICLFYAIHALGAIPCLANAWLPEASLAFCITNSGAKVAIVDDERALVLKSSVNGLKKAGCGGILCVSSKGTGQALVLQPGMESMEKKLLELKGKRELERKRVEILPEDIACIFFTSGTTGLPKGVHSTNRQFLSNLPNTIVAGSRALLRRGEEFPVPDPSLPQKALLLSVPLFHVTGNQSLLTLMTHMGGKIVLIHKWDIKEATRLIKREGITLAGGVPFMVMEMIDAGLKESTLEGFTFGGAQAPEVLPQHLRKKNEERIGVLDASATTAYGLTESNSILTSLSAADYESHPTSCGRVSPINRMKVIDMKSGKTLAAGEVGELLASGPNIAEGYWNNPKATAEAFSPDGWFKTGDIGYVCKEGYVYILDRAKEIIIRGGENIATVTVENALYLDDRVKDCAVLPVPHPRLGEVVSAIVVVKPSAYASPPTEASLQELVRRTLPAYSVPVMIVIQREELLRNITGKVLKKELKIVQAELWAKRNQIEAKL